MKQSFQIMLPNIRLEQKRPLNEQHLPTPYPRAGICGSLPGARLRSA